KGMGKDHLHSQAWEIVSRRLQKAEAEALAQYRQSSGTGLASKDVPEIVVASFHGRVGILFVAIGRKQWGAFQPETDTVYLHPRMEAGSEDLLDTAAAHVFLNGGSVFILPGNKMPDDSAVAAVFRY
ncbi:MAG: hypothetical protein PHY31_05015, partial [Smithellaceae bacterium]|nr:hypothetical protein [Smithellaceae bacterium]